LITDEPEANSLEIIPNFTAELNDEGELMELKSSMLVSFCKRIPHRIADLSAIAKSILNKSHLQ
jgi:hypothetical protein